MSRTTKNLKKEDVIKMLRTPRNYYSMSNDNKNIKSDNFIADNLERCIVKTIANILTPTGRINIGVVGEIITKNDYNSSKKTFSYNGSDMTKGNKTIEVKTLVNPSNLPSITERDLKADEIIVLTLEGYYTINPKNLIPLLNKKDYFKDSKRMKMKAVKEVGTLDVKHSSKLILA